MRIPRPLALLASMAAAGALAAALAFTPAGAVVSDYSPPVSDNSPPANVTVAVGGFGRVADRGLTVYLPVTLNCSTPSPQTNVSFTVRERVGNRIASANGYTTVACNGRTEVMVRGDAFDVPFRRGRSVVDLTVYACGPYPCNPVSVHKDVYLL